MSLPTIQESGAASERSLLDEPVTVRSSRRRQSGGVSCSVSSLRLSSAQRTVLLSCHRLAIALCTGSSASAGQPPQQLRQPQSAAALVDASPAALTAGLLCCRLCLSPVLSLERSLDFLTHVFNMKVLRHEEAEGEGAAASPSSSSSLPRSTTLVGLTSEAQFCLQLQYSYAQPAAAARSASCLRFITVKVPGAASRAKTAGWRVDTSGDSEALAVISGPDGMSFRCIDNALSPSHADSERDAVVAVSLSVADVDRSLPLYTGALGMQAFRGGDRSSEGRRQGDAVQLGYDRRQTRIELVHAGQAAAEAAEAAGEAAGRIAFSSSSVQAVCSRAQAAKADIVQAEAELLVLRDPDGLELCFIADSRLQRRSERGRSADSIDWQLRERRQREADVRQAAGRREEKEEPQSAEAAPALPLTAVGRLVDESEFEEGGDNKQPAAEAKQADAAAADKQRQQQAHTPEARHGSAETTYITSSWISSPHEKVPSPAASGEDGD